MMSGMQFVYLCGPGMAEELKYSIRSLIKNFKDPDIVLIGNIPPWYTGNFISVSQDETKYANVHKNLEAAIASSQIKDKFVIMNDDFYILEKIDSIGYFHEGTLKNKYKKYLGAYASYSYVKKITQTHDRLTRAGFSDPLSYDLHIPFLVEKEKLAKVVKYKNLLWRSMYGNIFNVGGEEASDVKVYLTNNMGFKDYDYLSGQSPFLSTNDSSFKLIERDLLKGMFGEKSYLEA
jgi:hypothetical protein